MNQTHVRHPRPGFTLVEILTVIVIIGILAGIAIPAITGALRTAREAAIRTEIDVIGQALEAYRQQHGEYPPDFSDWKLVEKHFRKAFPDIDNDELKVLAQFTWLTSGFSRVTGPGDPDPRFLTTGPTYEYHPQQIDRAEALVFCLGGYSSDKKHPLTGQGGPLALIASEATTTPMYLRYQYNIDRNNGFIELDTDQLSLRQFNIPGETATTDDPLNIAATYTYSGDEIVTSALASWAIATSSTANAGGIPCLADPFPTYTVGRSELPLAYFEADQYAATFFNTPASSPLFPAVHYLNVYMPPGGTLEQGIARPYASTVVDTNAATPQLQFAENGSFQLISAGLDNSYGGIFPRTVGGTDSGGAVFVYGNGKAYNPYTFSGSGQTVSTLDKYADDDILKAEFGDTSAPYRNLQPQLDNITNFATRTLESDLP